MADELVSALLKDVGLRVVLATTGELSRQARAQSQLGFSSAALLAQGLTAAALMGALQKDQSRVNIQLECDGLLRGLFVDGDAEGRVRGYVKNPRVDLLTGSDEFRWRPALGNSGFLSVLKDLGSGEVYRSSVELVHFDVARDLERYFQVSDQIRTALAIEEVPRAEDALSDVLGILLQPLPDGDAAAFDQLSTELHGQHRLAEVARAHPAASATALMRALAPDHDVEVMSRFPLSFSCSCSREGVMRALVALGRTELEDVLAKEGKAEATCQFCTTHYEISGDEIRQLLVDASG